MLYMLYIVCYYIILYYIVISFLLSVILFIIFVFIIIIIITIIYDSRLRHFIYLYFCFSIQNVFSKMLFSFSDYKYK